MTEATNSFYQYHVFCCENRRDPGSSRGCCASKGSEALRGYFKDRVKKLGLSGQGKIRINGAGCLDRCELGPVIVIYPDETWYYAENTDDIDAIIDSHLLQGTPVERLKLSATQKRR